MALDKKNSKYKRRQRDKTRYLSFVSILSQNSMSADANWKMRVPTLRASQLPEDLLETYEEAFYLLDTDNTGVIGKKEVGIVMRAIGQEPTDEEIENLVKEVDRTETGRLSFNDFLALLAHICQEEEPEEEWERVFQQFDHNKDGFIDEHDLRKTMLQLRLKFTDTDVDEMLNEFAPLRDSGPRRIDFEDFLSILT
ncbi:neo-calmodulin-like isoform X1 [Styela clava]|uniref:calmodulin-beta-like n=1 Tax=Styela clava TaxID=7725 RepID=UPI0019397670|nr:calmodulin-beta-like [Styela clava]